MVFSGFLERVFANLIFLDLFQNHTYLKLCVFSVFGGGEGFTPATWNKLTRDKERGVFIEVGRNEKKTGRPVLVQN